MKEISLGGRIFIDVERLVFYFWKYMSPATLFLNQVRARITTQGGWSRRARFPETYQREAPQKRVFLITREDRRFAVVANNFVEADNHLTILLA